MNNSTASFIRTRFKWLFLYQRKNILFLTYPRNSFLHESRFHSPLSGSNYIPISFLLVSLPLNIFSFCPKILLDLFFMCSLKITNDFGEVWIELRLVAVWNAPILLISNFVFFCYFTVISLIFNKCHCSL